MVFTRRGTSTGPSPVPPAQEVVPPTGNEQQPSSTAANVVPAITVDQEMLHMIPEEEQPIASHAQTARSNSGSRFRSRSRSSSRNRSRPNAGPRTRSRSSSRSIIYSRTRSKSPRRGSRSTRTSQNRSRYRHKEYSRSTSQQPSEASRHYRHRSRRIGILSDGLSNLNVSTRSSFQPPETKLSDSCDFQYWRTYMEFGLSDEETWLEVINHNYTTDQLHELGLLSADRQVKKFLMYSVDMHTFKPVAKCSTAYEMWTSLCNRFEAKYNLDDLEDDITLAVIGNNETLQDHFDKMMARRTAFEDAGGSVPDLIFLKYLKRSLSRNEMRDDLRIATSYCDINNVQDFMKYMIKRDPPARRPTASSSSTASRTATSEPKSTFPANPSSSRMCGNCGKTNHPTTTCRYRGGAQEQKCSVCSKYGHLADRCYSEGGGMAHLRPSSFGQPKQRALAAAPDANAATSSNRTPLGIPSKTMMAPDNSSSWIEEVRKVIREEVRSGTTEEDTNFKTVSSALSAVTGFAALACITPGSGFFPMICDSGATCHMVNDASILEDFRPCHQIVRTAHPDHVLTATGIGTARVLVSSVSSTSVSLSNVLYIPNLSSNLLSVKQILDDNMSVEFDKTCARITKNKETLAVAHQGPDRQFVFQFMTSHSVHLSIGRNSHSFSSLRELHEAAGHMNPSVLKEAIDQDRVSGISVGSKDVFSLATCDACLKGKMTKSPFPATNTKLTTVGEVIHADLWFPGENSLSGCSIALILVDGYSNFVWAIPLKTKEGKTITQIWSEVVAFIRTQTGKSVKALQTDNGREFVNEHMASFNRTHGISHRTSVPFAHQQNGTAERMNRTVSEGTLSNILHANANKSLWAEAMLHFVHARNRLASSAVPSKSPYELVLGSKPDVSYLRAFGTPVSVLVPPEKRRNLDEKACIGRIVGYKESAAYRVLIRHNLVIDTRDVRPAPSNHLQSLPLFQTTTTGNTPSSTTVPRTLSNQVSSNFSNDQLSPRRSSRVSHPSQRLLESQESHFADFPSDSLLIPFAYFSSSSAPYDFSPETILKSRLPRNVKNELLGSDRDGWVAAIIKETSNFINMDVFSFRSRSPDDNPLPGMLLLTRKPTPEGGFDFKARWVVRGDLQKQGQDYLDTYSLAGDYTTYRLLGALSCLPQSFAFALDVKGAFLYAPIDRPVIAEIPPFLVPANIHNPVAVLNKAVYGLKQAPLLFRNHLSAKMLEEGYQSLISSPSLYTKTIVQGEMEARLMSAFYVDDAWCLVLITRGERTKEVEETTSNDVKKHFDIKIKDLREDSLILGMRMKWLQDVGELRISIPAKIEQLAVDLRLIDAKPVNHPMLPDALAMFDQDESEVVEQFPYARAVGSLLWIGTVARPDVAFAAGVLSRYMASPRQSQVQAVKRVVRYLMGTKELGLRYKRQPQAVANLMEITGYSDSDLAGDKSDFKSTSGFVVMVNGAPVMWRSRKQSIQARSVAEAEYVAASECITEMLWLRNVFVEMKIQVIEPMRLHVDNKAAIAMASKDVHVSKSKSINIKVHHLKELVKLGNLEIVHIDGTRNPADILTKPLPGPAHKSGIQLLCLQ